MIDSNSTCSPDLLSPLSNSITSISNIVGPPSSHRFSTLCATIDSPDSDHHDRHGSSAIPIYQSATFKGLNGKYDYSRSGNPTRTFLQHHIAKISSAKHAFAVTSGMGALDIILRILKPGDEIIAGNDLYGGSDRLLNYLQNHNDIITHHLDTTDINSIKPFLFKDSKVKLVLLESPTNPLLQIVDLQEISRQVKAIIPHALIVVDNTMMSPYLMKPLEFGVDIVYDSATKYLSGHHDLMAGLVICNSDQIAKHLAFIINSVGNGLAPFECFLLLRGIKTLAIRLDRQQQSTIRVANYLNQLGFKVNYPGLQNHKAKQIHDRLAKGPGAVLSFETGDKHTSERIVSSTRLWGISVSFGCVNSLISMPCLMSHASIDPAVRAARNLPEDLIRLCVGIEDCDDLLEDLQAALIEAGAIRSVDETAFGIGYERIKHPNLINSQNQVGIIHQNSNQNSPGPVEAAKLTSSLANNPTHLLASAPGKVILFGEHAVVFGKKAMAAAVNLRCYCLVEPSSHNTITFSLPDSDFTASWSLDDLPWLSVKPLNSKDQLNIDEDLSRLLFTLSCDKSNKSSVIQACHAFLYLYINLAKNVNRQSQVYTVRSSLPIGAGLGSSASFCVCLASSLLYTHQHIPFPTGELIQHENVDAINHWAFLGEKIIHGNPSGVDNTVSSFGGAICFIKKTGSDDAKKNSIEQIKEFHAIRLLITDTRVPRDTKALVGNVAQRKKNEPDFIQEVLNEIENITNQAINLIKAGSDLEPGIQTRDQWIKKFGQLIESNHIQLTALGVSHEKLECAKKIAMDDRFKLKTKLTGAGGGGCAISLMPDDFSDKDFNALKAAIENEGMKTYETQIGIKGVEIQTQLMKNLESTKKQFLSSEINQLNNVLLMNDEKEIIKGWTFA